MSSEIRALGSHEWRELRAVPLRALEELPDAFSRTLCESLDLPGSYWQV